MQAAKMRMIRLMCGKTLRDGISNGLLRDWTGIEYMEDHLGKTRLRWLGHFERMDETKLVKRVREEKVPGMWREEGRKNYGMRWWKRIRKREAYASMPKTKTSGDDAVEGGWPELTGKKILPSRKNEEELGLNLSVLFIINGLSVNGNV